MPQKRPRYSKSEQSRSVWNTTLIFVTLAVLTVLMALAVRSMVKGSMGTPVDHPFDSMETNASHKP